MGSTIITLPLVALLVGLTSCSSATAVAPSTVPSAAAPPIHAASEREIALSEFGTVVSVKRGDVLIIKPPMKADEWQVLFDEAMLSSAATADERSHPGPAGWRFTVVGTGETELTLTAVFRGGPNPPRFSLTLRAG